MSVNAPTGSSTIAASLNDQGTVVGLVTTYNNLPTSRLAIFKNGDTQIVPDVSVSFDTRFEGLKINASEQIAGTYHYQLHTGGQVYTSAFLYSNGTFTDLGQLQGWSRSAASGINDSGVVAGYFAMGNRWDAYSFDGTNATDIAPHGYIFSVARGINSLGQIVGRADSQLQPRVLFYDPQAGITSLLGNGTASAINDSQMIVGATGSDSLNPLGLTAAIFDLNGGVQPILSGCPSEATDVNAAGIVVGYTVYCPTYGFYGGFVFDTTDPNGQPTSLTSLIPADSGWTIQNALGINALGQIAAIGRSSQDNQTHALLLTPT